jgi:transcriptional regulator with XRE-family HTH domain
MVKRKETDENTESRELLEAIGERVKILRKAAGLNQKQLAEFVGMHQTYIHMVEAGTQNITVSVLNRFAIKFNTPIGSFFPEVQLQDASDEVLTHLVSVVEKLADELRSRGRRDAQVVEEIGTLVSSVRRRLEKKPKKANGVTKEG